MIRSKNRFKYNFLRYLSFLILLFFIIPVQFSILGLTLKVGLLCVFVLSISFLIYVFCFRKVSRDLLYIIMYLVVVFGASFYILLMNDFNDLSYHKDLFLGALLAISAFMVVKMYRKNFQDEFAFLLVNHISLVGALNSIFMLLVFFSSDFSSFLYEFVVIDPKDARSIELGFRNPGLFYTGFSKISLLYSILIIVKLSFSILNNRSFSTSDYAVFFLLFIGIVFSGRTGLLLLVFGVLIFSIFLLLRGNFYGLARVAGGSTTFIACLGIIFVGLSFYGYGYYFEWFLEFLMNYLSSGRLATDSTDALISSHYFLPDSSIGVLLGDGNFGRQEGMPYISSDVGYVLFIHGMGVIGLMMSLVFFVLVFAISLKMDDDFVKFSLFYIVFALLVGNFKDQYWFSNIGYSQILFILIFLGEEMNSFKIRSSG